MSVPVGLEALFDNLRPRSRASLEMAIRTHQVEGVPATIAIQISSSAGKPVEVFLTTAPSSLTSDLWRWGAD